MSMAQYLSVSQFKRLPMSINEASTGLHPWYPSLSSAESAEAPSFALRASEGPTVAFIHGHTPMVFCEGG